MAYKFTGKPGALYLFDVKLNSNCPDAEKTGTGKGSCGGKTPEKEPKKFLGMSDIEKQRGERLDLPNATKKYWMNALGETKLPPDEKGFYYHATTIDRIPSIGNVGLKPGISKPNFPAEINRHMDTTFLSKRLNDVPGEPYGSEYWSRMIFRSNQNKPVILRIKETSLHNVDEEKNEYEYRTKDPILPENIEMLKHGKWIPLISQKQNARFALEQVKKEQAATGQASKASIEVLRQAVQEEKMVQKQNMVLDGVKTTDDLDRQVLAILKSIEPDVIKIISKTKYFDKSA